MKGFPKLYTIQKEEQNLICSVQEIYKRNHKVCSTYPEDGVLQPERDRRQSREQYYFKCPGTRNHPQDGTASLIFN